MTEKEVHNIIVKAKGDGKLYGAEAGNLDLSLGDEIIFEFEQFQDVGCVADSTSSEVFPEESKVSIIRKLTAKDREKIAEQKKEAKSLIGQCNEKIKKHSLDMDLLDADLSYDGKKLTFYFTAAGRVDFRSLVPDLASTFKKLIRLQQVGSRDKAKCMKNVIGRCGRDTCCRQVLKGDLENVTAEMATDQNLGQMGSNRVTGVCGKLQCCLKFELDEYQKIKKKMPAIGSQIKTKEGEGVVIAHNIIKNKYTVELSKDRRVLEVDC